MEEKEKTSALPEEASAKEKQKKRGRLRAWWQAHKPTKRRLIQVYVALLVNANLRGFATGRIYAGATKGICVPGLNCYSCPAAVGACPLGALQNAFAQSGTRAPYYVFGILLLFGLLFARTVCGFFCPVGLGQELLYKIRTPKLSKNRFTYILSYLKYVILAVFVVAIPLIYGLKTQTPVPGFCKYICPAGTLGGAIGLLIHPSNSGLYEGLGGLFTWKFAVLVAVLLLSVFIFRFFCRFLCPLGAIYSLFNRIALFGVKLDKNACTDCGLCVSHCKMDVRRVGDHECIQCGECIDVCPAKAISWKGSKLVLHPASAPVAAEKPLTGLLRPETELSGVAEDTAAETVSSAAEAAPAETVPAEVPAPAEEVAPTEASSGPVPAKKRERRQRIFRIAACAAALVLLVGAFVYYNAFDRSAPPVDAVGGNQTGEVCYDFELPLYNGGGTFRLSEHRGKIVLINFWATWCASCVTELPEFERLKEEYAGEVEVVAIHSANITEDVQNYLNTKSDVYDGSRTWKDWQILFAQDEGTALQSVTYDLLGGTGSYPMTLIVDREGVIQLTRSNSVTYDMLKLRIELLLAAE